MMYRAKQAVFASLIFVLSFLLSSCASNEKKAPATPSNLQNDLQEMDKPSVPVAKAPTPSSGDDALLGEEAPAPKPAQNKVNALKPEDSGDSELYQRFNNARISKNMRVAQEVAGEILTRNPSDTKVLNALSVMAIEEGKYDMARLLLGKVLQKEPTNAAAMNNMGVIELKTDNLRLALIQFKKATEADSRNRSAHANLGSIYLQYRNYPNAVVELEAAVDNGDQSPATLSNLGFARTGAGEYSKAADAYEKALAKDQSNVPIMLNYAALLVDHNMAKDKATRLLNKIRFVAHEPAILNKVEILLRKAEGGNKSVPPGAGKGDLD